MRWSGKGRGSNIRSRSGIKGVGGVGGVGKVRFAIDETLTGCKMRV